MFISKKVMSGLIGIAASIFIASAQAAPITVPTGLNVGDSYRLAFVTSNTMNAISSNLADYNAFVTAAANSQATLAALGTAWYAIASNAAGNARSNTGTDPTTATGVPIYLLDSSSTKLADNNADLWDGTRDTPLNITEAGTIWTGSLVWTGTDADGLRTDGFFSGFGTTKFGLANDSGMAGINAGRTNPELSGSIYAISDVLTVAVAVPAPAGLALFGLGIAGIMCVCRKRAT
ncbi:MAG: PEP-CTERM sorting domain-containing protein [Alphaproteobacteria bacterium]|nr:PEP-CTERM sorting domain-containing protein [Alphaproteobacteria bacterium]